MNDIVFNYGLKYPKENFFPLQDTLLGVSRYICLQIRLCVLTIFSKPGERKSLFILIRTDTESFISPY
ncbi:hypothetical protein [Parapedobacter tibetensis]|uniref:hypothetical protein n=1 Tax=Parapedobacter tibetensis TaxID=2972951 RepID=UPI00214D38F5|nr:hypothetical protein [Parapedobacter tibetensis]